MQQTGMPGPGPRLHTIEKMHFPSGTKSRRDGPSIDVPTIFRAPWGEAMKWYYEWKLKRIRAEIVALEQETRARLLDDFTAHSRLRVLRRLADSIQQRLARYPGRPVVEVVEKKAREAQS